MDNRVLAQAFLQNYISAAQINLTTGDSQIIKCDMFPELVNRNLPWSELTELYANKRVFGSDQTLVRTLTLDYLKNCPEKFPLVVRVNCGNAEFRWVEIAVSIIEPDKNVAIVCTRDVDQSVREKKILEIFIYQNYDYIVLINTKNDSYIRYTGAKGTTPLPSVQSNSYTDELIRYNEAYVQAEDRRQTTDHMRIPHVIEMLAQSDPYSFTSSGISLDGQYRHTLVTFMNYDKEAGLVLCARTDVTPVYLEQQEQSQQLAKALREAQLDALTNLYNQKATAELITRSLKNQYHNMAVLLFIDIDNFKMVNDTFGHQKGDELLQYLARSIRDIAGREGIAGRIGGDEYLLYLPSVYSVDEIEKTALKICHIFNLLPNRIIQADFLSCSIGISVYPRDGINYETLLRKADQALYTSKRYGKNRFYFYSYDDMDMTSLQEP